MGLYGLTDTGRLVWWDGGDTWADLDAAPSGATGLAMADCTFYAATESGQLWRRPFASRGWEQDDAIRPAGDSRRGFRMSGLAAMSGRLFAGLAGDRVLNSLPGRPWEEYDVRLVAAVFTAHAGALLAADRETALSRHTVRRHRRQDSHPH
ncbi:MULTISPECIES: hypothetical protein [unclassified Nonomuraea]|uniref:hypothetical protein n=1 Tax=unclassified Nonomuraea TaxID=2593643 RepID=UPI0033CAF9F7